MTMGGRLTPGDGLARDGAGNLLELQIDRDGDGVVDRWERHTYVDGQQVRSTYDYDADGVIDGVRTRDFDADRLLALRRAPRAATAPRAAWRASGPLTVRGWPVYVTDRDR